MVRLEREAIVAVDDRAFSSSSEQYLSEDAALGRQAREPIYNGYVYAFSIQGCLVGFLTTFVGILQVCCFPIICDNYNGNISVSSDFFYGFALWSGITLTITSATGIRSTISKRQSTINRYLVMQVLTTIVYTFAIAFTIQALAEGSLNNLGSCMTAGHVMSASAIAISACLHLSNFCFNAFTIFKNKPMELFRYVFDAFLLHCCPQITTRSNSSTVQDD